MTEPRPETPPPSEAQTPEGVEDVPRVDFDVHTGQNLDDEELAPKKD